MGPVPSLWGIWFETGAWAAAFWPGAAVLLCGVAVGYAVGVKRQRSCLREAGLDRAVVAVGSRQVLFYGGLLVVAFAIMSPLDVLAQWLFSAHMIQHLLLLVVAPPLLVASAPLDPLWRAVPERLRSVLATHGSRLTKFAAVRWASMSLMSPWGALAVFAGTMWFWHVPAPYDLTLSNLYVHILEHTMFLAAGLLWWSRLISCPPLRARLSTHTDSMPATVIFLMGTVAQNVVLAMVIGLATHPLYAPYAALLHRPTGLSALADQEWGAGFMWTLGDLPFSIALGRLVYLWLSNLEAEEMSVAHGGVGDQE
ncbi:MAG: cytochrome c oxidase assembly protein [Actinomycetota bacterium]|nr:cytochrome c oxidase assembly protein [Actinomycetota bacterium]